MAARESAPAPAPAPDAPTVASIDAPLIDLITRPIEAGLTAELGFRRKEAALRALFATLSPADNLRLQRRLDAGRRDDAVVAAFARLIPARRHRLLELLAELRRCAGRRS